MQSLLKYKRLLFLWAGEAMSSNLPVDTTIIAAVVSAIVSVAVLLVSSYVIQPRRIRQSWSKEHLEKRLAVHGELVTILDSLEAKGRRQGITGDPQVKKEAPFEMENPSDYNRLLSLIEKQNYLFSQGISQLWFKLLSDDKYHSFFSSSIKPNGTLLVDLTELQTVAKKEYAELRKAYETLTGIKLPVYSDK